MRGKKVACEITLEEAYNGKTAKIPISRQKNCGTCDGKGGASTTTCKACKGRGVQQKVIQMGPMIQTLQQECGPCNGEGQIISEADKCKTCKGKKVFKQDTVVDTPIDKVQE